MAEETPEQVTLDDLPAIDYERVADEYSTNDLAICHRCGGLIFYSTFAQSAHERWHAAIETLAGTISTEVSADFFDNSPPTITVKGSHALRTSVTPEQRRELVVALGLDPNRAADCTWPAIIDRVQDIAAGRDRCKRDHSQWWPGEVERLRRIEDALIAVGAPNRSERGDPGGLTVAWIKRQTELMAELRAKDEAAKQAVKLLAERPTREAYNIAMEQRALLEEKRQECERLHGPLTSPADAIERFRLELVEALGLDQNTGFYDALDVIRNWRLELEAVRRGIADREIDATITRRHHALLMLAAKGRLDYADGAPDDQAQKLGFEADMFLLAANLVAQPNRIGMLIPYRMQTAEALAEVGVDYPVGEVQGDGTVVVREPAPAEAEVCPSLCLVNDELRACMYDKHSDLMQHGDDAFVWSTND
jgi:hypothetical protein